MKNNNNFYRGKRLRTDVLRAALSATSIGLTELVQPLFVLENAPGLQKNSKLEISSMPGIFQHTLTPLLKEIEECVQLGINNFILFGIPQNKDATGSSSLKKNAIIPAALRKIKKHFPSILLISDICLCEYTSHGHCGVLQPNGEIDNDKTAAQLAKQAVLHAESGASIIAPSAMCDGMVKFIRNALDHANFCETPILSYAIKYASSFYGPFREAANSTPQFGSRNSYQISPKALPSTAIAEALADIDEGADILMVKPALPYLDVLHALKIHPNINLPLAAYQVSGEYAMLMAAQEKGWLSLDTTIDESLACIRRAGAKIIISYFTKRVAMRKRKNLD